MTCRYFDLSSDVYVPGRWYLDEPVDERSQEVDCWMFTTGQPVHIEGRLAIPISDPGRPLDFSTTNVGATPVVHVKVASLFAELAPNDVQLLPVDVEAQPEQYSILVAPRLIRCIDPEASEE